MLLSRNTLRLRSVSHILLSKIGKPPVSPGKYTSLSQFIKFVLKRLVLAVTIGTIVVVLLQHGHIE